MYVYNSPNIHSNHVIPQDLESSRQALSPDTLHSQILAISSLRNPYGAQSEIRPAPDSAPDRILPSTQRENAFPISPIHSFIHSFSPPFFAKSVNTEHT